ncbi:MAG: hypothetical protein HFF04_08885 [Oscillospiraceae bacterium]|nr:hypothetical protein [Oscillospiraceae bacterium]
MNFGKKLHYLGVQQNIISTDNSVYYAVSFFDPMGNVPVSVNVMGTNTEIVSALSGLQMGDLVDVQFVLRPKDKLYRLGLVSVNKTK